MNNIIPHEYHVDQAIRSTLKNHKPLVVWFSGLSGSGKSTIANALEKHLFQLGIHTYSLDGDNVRAGLNGNLGFSTEDRTENIRRVAEVAKLFYDSGVVVLAAFITPLETDRKLVENVLGKEVLLNVFVDTPLDECERRDVKGLYSKARKGEIENFTGISAPFEVPRNPDLTIFTEKEGIKESINKILEILLPKIKLKDDK